MRCFVFFLLSLFIPMSGCVLAAPSLYGSTGLISLPSADILRADQVSVGYYHLVDGNALSVVDLHVADHLEAGLVDYFQAGHGHNQQLNVKFCLADEKVLLPGVAVGVADVTNGSQRSFYAVASKGLPFGYRLHVGTGSGQYDRFFAGLEKRISPLGLSGGSRNFPTTVLMAEYDGHVMNYGARVSLAAGWKLDAGCYRKSRYVGISFTS